MVVAGGFGLANAVLAVVLLLLVPRGSHRTGWFAYAPLADYKVPPGSVSQTDWALIVTPAALVVLNFLLVVLAARRRWLAPQ
jgi:heme/copper-type cytochrome/quinol oxidase subunit 1